MIFLYTVITAVNGDNFMLQICSKECLNSGCVANYVNLRHPLNSKEVWVKVSVVVLARSLIISGIMYCPHLMIGKYIFTKGKTGS